MKAFLILAILAFIPMSLHAQFEEPPMPISKASLKTSSNYWDKASAFSKDNLIVGHGKQQT